MSEKPTSRKRKSATVEDMRPEYDFSNAVRGKYYQAYTRSTNVVVLEPDVAKRFKNAAAVNEALRSIISSKNTGRRLTTRSTRTPRKRAAG